MVDVSSSDLWSIIYDGKGDFQQVGQNKERIAELKAELHRLSSQISAISISSTSASASPFPAVLAYNQADGVSVVYSEGGGSWGTRRRA